MMLTQDEMEGEALLMAGTRLWNVQVCVCARVCVCVCVWIVQVGFRWFDGLNAVGFGAVHSGGREGCVCVCVCVCVIGGVWHLGAPPRCLGFAQGRCLHHLTLHAHCARTLPSDV